MYQGWKGGEGNGVVPLSRAVDVSGSFRDFQEADEQGAASVMSRALDRPAIVSPSRHGPTLRLALIGGDN